MVNKSVNYWTCQLYYYAFSGLKLTKTKMHGFLLEAMTMAHWIRLSLLCRCKWSRKSDLWGKNVSEHYLLLCKHKRCIVHKWKRLTKTYQEKLDFLSNESRFLCMHKILVHAQHSCACTGGATAQGRDPKRALGVRPGQESCACTRILIRLTKFPTFLGTSWYVFSTYA